jgi:hypothetical protein
MNRLTIDEISALAAEFGLETKTLRAVIQVESAGAGFAPNGDIKIQFEPHWFKRYTGHIIDNKVDIQTEEWAAYKEAKAINWEAALLSTSWGLGQVMGFNFKAAGYNSVGEMVAGFKTGEKAQLRGMLNFIKNNFILDELQRKDWAGFAKVYNGAGYKQFNYDKRLQEAYDKL